MLRSVLYTSSAMRGFTRDDLRDVLASSRRNNAACGLTGVLLFEEGVFLQVLEGPSDTVTTKLRQIEVDPRHCRLDLLYETQTDRRYFPEWAMGSRELDEEGSFALTEVEMQARMADDVPAPFRVLIGTFFRLRSPYAA